MNPSPGSLSPRPLSYEDLRRFLFLLIGLALSAVIIHAVADILILFVVIVFAAMVLNPVVVWLEKRKLRRGLAVVVVMLGLIGSVVGVGALVAPPLVEQGSSLVQSAPTYSKRIGQQVKTILNRFPQLERALPPEYKGENLDKLDQTLGKRIGPELIALLKKSGPNVGSRVLTLGIALVGSFFTFIIALLLLAFILSNPKPLLVGFLSIIPARHREATGRSFARIENQMVAWMRATLINGALTSIQTMIFLYFIGLPSVIVFGILAFCGEFVPNIGPLVASIPALFVSAGLGTDKFIWTIVAILFVQNVSSNLLVPFIMGRELELHPVTIVFFALTMGGLFGIAGAILAVPLAAITKVLIDEFLIKANAVPTEELEIHAEKLVTQRKWRNVEPDEKVEAEQEEARETAETAHGA